MPDDRRQQADQTAQYSAHRRKDSSDKEHHDVQAGPAIDIIRDVAWHEQDDEEPDQTRQGPDYQSSQSTL